MAAAHHPHHHTGVTTHLRMGVVAVTPLPRGGRVEVVVIHLAWTALGDPCPRRHHIMAGAHHLRLTGGDLVGAVVEEEGRGR